MLLPHLDETMTEVIKVKTILLQNKVVRILSSVPFILCFITSATSTFAAPSPICDPETLELAGGDYPYAPRSRGKYCEGTYVVKASDPFEIIALVHRSIVYEPSRDESIILSVPFVKSVKQNSIRLRAISNAANSFYRMDAQISPGGVFRWPTQVVLRRKGLS